MAINEEDSKELRIKLGKNIKDARTKIGLTQSQLGELLGKSDNVITNWEKGTNRPDADMLGRLCDILKVSPNWLLSWDDRNTTLAAHRIDGYDYDLPEEAQQELENFIGYLKTKYKKK